MEFKPYFNPNNLSIIQPSLFATSPNDNLLPQDGEVFLYPNFLTAIEATYYFESLQTEINWRQEPIIIFGKKIMQPRLTALYGNSNKPYSYSGITMQPTVWSPTLLQIKQKIEGIAQTQFTTALLNFYRNGKDSMGWHRDNEKMLGINPVIASVSFGATRKFMLRHYTHKQLVQSVALTHGSLLLMRGKTQHCWEHQLPKTTRVLHPRINITFRVVI